MAINILEILSMVGLKDMGPLNGVMDKFMLAIGRTMLWMGFQILFIIVT